MNELIDLLDPALAFRENYLHQLQQTIEAYSIPLRVLGEPLQNAIDAVEDTPAERGKIAVTIDFDNNKIIVADNGQGFPKDPKLLFLGGTKKVGKNQRGRVGVGIKVTIYSSDQFRIRARTIEGSWKVEIESASKFQQLKNLAITIADDPEPLPTLGTELEYVIPKGLLQDAIRSIVETSLPEGITRGFAHALALKDCPYPSVLAALIASFLKRYTYLGDVMPLLGKSRLKKGLDVEVTIKCSDPTKYFDTNVGPLYGAAGTQKFTVFPEYLTVAETVVWAPKGFKKPELYHDKLGKGGENLQRTDGFNALVMTSIEDYTSLLTNKRGNTPADLAEYQKYLFPKINGIALTIGRIPDFENYLPGGSSRIISANGVVTGHDINPTSGRNQEYVRCIDFIVDVNAELNYGKTQLTDMQLVNRVRRFVNHAYSAVLQNAAGNWVGTMPILEDEEEQIFTKRIDLGLPNLIQRKLPNCENDVIALFFELAGHSHFPDYRIFGLSSFDRYDGKAAIKREVDSDKVFDPQDDSKLRNIEFKLHASEVLRDFEVGQKLANEIALVIAWDEGDKAAKDYKIYDINYSKAYKEAPQRVYPGATKYIYDAKQGTEVQILLLQTVVENIKAQSANGSQAPNGTKV
jgi:hypothetical protein